MKTFYAILANSLAASLTNTFVWFAVTFWVYLQTKSVLATSVMAGVYLVTVAIWRSLHVPDGCVWLVTRFGISMGRFVGVLEFRIYCWRVSCRKERLRKKPPPNALSGKYRHVDDLHFLYDSGIHCTADDWFIYLLMPDSGCRSFRANHHTNSDTT